MDQEINNNFSKSKIAVEIDQLRTIGTRLTPEFILRGLRTTMSSERIPEHDPVPTHRVNGRIVAGRGLFLGTTQVNNLINELKEILVKDQINDALHKRILELWITVEPCLLDAELNQLGPIVFKRLFNDKDIQVIFSRDGRPEGGAC
jgi:hypothetical protein